MDITPETIEAIKEALAPLAKAIGESAEYVFALAIRQNSVYALREALIIVVILVAFVLSTRIMRKAQARYFAKCPKNDWPDWLDDQGYLAVLPAVTGITLSVFLATTDLWGRLLNPEWYAITDLISKFGG